MTRHESFGQKKLGPFDRFLFYLRTRQLKSYFGDTGTVIEVGSGYNAHLLTWLGSNYNIDKIVAMDLSLNPELQKTGIVPVHGNANEPLPFEDTSTDQVIFLALLEHLEQPQQFLNEVYRILKPGGVLLLTTPTPAAKPILEFMAYGIHLIEAAEIDDHKNYFSQTNLRDMMLKAGFKKENIKLSRFTLGLNNFVHGRKHE